MLLGLCQTSAEGSLSLLLNRFHSRLRFFGVPSKVILTFFFLFEQTSPALPVLKRLVQSADEEVLTDACWALSYLSDSSNDKIQAVIDAGVIPRLIDLLA